MFRSNLTVSHIFLVSILHWVTMPQNDLTRRSLRSNKPAKDLPKEKPDTDSSLSEDENVDDDVKQGGDHSSGKKRGLYPELPDAKHVGLKSTLKDTKAESSSHSANSGTKGIAGYLIFAIVVVVVVAVGIVIFKCRSGSSDLQTQVRNIGVSEILNHMKRFKNQPDLTHKVIRMALSKVIPEQNTSEPLAPAILLLVSSYGAQDVATCFANELANVISSDSKYTTIDGRRYHNKDPNEVKLAIDKSISDTLKGQQKVVFIKHLDLIPSRAALMLHSYCDHENAPYKDAVFIMTVDADRDIPDNSDSKQFDDAAISRLRTVWSSDLSEDILNALLSRITVSVAAILPDSC